MTVANPIPRLVRVSIVRPWATLAAGLLLALLAGLFAADRFAMTTDTAALISPQVPWRQQERRMEAAFPQLRDAMLIVIDGRTPELAEDGAARLAARLAGDKRHFRDVSRPDGGDFFAREGLLYGSVAEVRAATGSLVKAQPLLGPLAADPSLRGVATALGTALDGVTRGQASLADLEPAMRSLANTGDAVLAGRPAFFSWQRLIAGGGQPAPTRRLVLVRPVLDYGALQPGADAADAVRAAAGALGLDAAHGVSARLTGEVPIADEEFATLQENIGLVGAVMLVAMLLTLWLATRSAKLVAAIMVTIVVGLVVTTAVGLAAVGQLNLISIAFIPLFVGLGVDFGIQISVRYNAERADGLAPADALRGAAAALAAPLGLAAAAVFLGFGAFLPTAYVGIAQLGIIAGLGMIVALALSVTLLPALVLVLRPGAPGREVGFRQMAPADRWLATHRRWVLWAFGVATVASIAALPLVRFDFNPFHLRSQTEPAMATLNDLTRDPDRTPATIDVLAPNAREGAALAKRLAALPEVRQVVSLDSFVPEDQAPKLALTRDASTLLDLTLDPFDVAPAPGDAELKVALAQLASTLGKAATDAVPTDAPPKLCYNPCPDPRTDPGVIGDARYLGEVAARLAAGTPAQRAAMNAAVSQPLAVMLNQTRAALQAQAVARDTLPADLRRDWVTPAGQVRLSVFPAGNANDNATLERFRAAVARVTPAISGLPVATQEAGRTISHAFVQAGIIAFALVSLLLFAVLRDAREVAFTLAPVILSIFLTLGSCVVIGQPINFANIIAFPLLFGVGVAFHIYFVMAWRAGATDLLQSSLARAVLFSALATGTAFGSLWLSHHPGTASMGKILLISLAWTLVCALIFEPALLGPPRPTGRADRVGA